jgi:hypothetical protein
VGGGMLRDSCLRIESGERSGTHDSVSHHRGRPPPGHEGGSDPGNAPATRNSVSTLGEGHPPPSTHEGGAGDVRRYGNLDSASHPGEGHPPLSTHEGGAGDVRRYGNLASALSPGKATPLPPPMREAREPADVTAIPEHAPRGPASPSRGPRRSRRCASGRGRRPPRGIRPGGCAGATDVAAPWR